MGTITLLKDYNHSNNSIYSIANTDDDDLEGTHPLHLDLKSGSIITNAEVIEHWEDDHELCVALSVTTTTNNYVISMLWITPEFLITLGKAVNNKEASYNLANDFK